MSTKIIFIGDIHIKFSNLTAIDKLQEVVVAYCERSPPAFFVLGGDILDSHERVNTQLLNRAYELVKAFKRIAHVYVIVGNHDYINNQQFLSDNHWMNGMKEWNNVTIVDLPTVVENYLLVPYVPNGRFVEAIETVTNDWRGFDCIFAHQEIKGCKMGAITSIDGDLWETEWPMLISGHIHERQNIGGNVLYPGSAINHAYSSDNQGVSEFMFQGTKVDEHRIDLKLEKKKTIHKNISDVDMSKIKLIDKNCRLTLEGEMKDITSFKKSQTYHSLIKKGVKVVFQKKKCDVEKDGRKDGRKDERKDERGCNIFNSILTTLIKEERDLELENDFHHISSK
ncbi:MAG: metallophosphoesterase [Cetobacterium sp.]